LARESTEYQAVDLRVISMEAISPKHS